MFAVVAFALLFGAATAADSYVPTPVPYVNKAAAYPSGYIDPKAAYPSGYTDPKAAYNSQTAYSGPSQAYKNPTAPYSNPPSSYGSQQTYSNPASAYSNPAPAYSNPDPAYSNPAGSYGNQQTYGNQAYSNQPYNNYGGSYAQVDLSAEVDEAEEDIVGLYAKANQLNSALDANSKNIQVVSQFRADVEGTIAPRVRALIKSQDYKIKEYREQLSALRIVKDAVEQLAQLIADLRKLLAEERNKRVVLVSKLEAISATGVEQDIDVAKLVALAAAESARIAEVSGPIYNNQVKNAELSDNLDAVLVIVNQERAETFNVQLSKSSPSATVSFSSAFASVPALEWGVVGLKLKRDQYSQNSYDKTGYNSYDNKAGYNSYDNKAGYNSYNNKASYNDIESWNFKVSANASTTSVTVSLADSSLDWSVESVAVRVTATLIDNSKLEYTSRKIDYSPVYGKVNYSSGNGKIDYNGKADNKTVTYAPNKN